MQTKKEEEAKEESKRECNEESLLTSRMGALLDFYSDRAVAHASFFVASVFGIVTILAIVLQISENNVSFFLFPIPLVWLSIPLFFVFSYMGHYSLIRFNFYADIAQKLADLGLKEKETLQKVSKDKKRTLWDYIIARTNAQERLFPRNIIKKKIYFWGILYWTVTFCLGLVVYSKSLNTVLERQWWLITSPIVIILVLIHTWKSLKGNEK